MDEGKGSHLIAWDKICRPKNEGGLRIRNDRLMNYSLLMKVGWGLMSKKDSLWARTLKSKYSCGMDVIPKIGKRNCNSNLWLGVYKFWDKVLQRTKWKVRSGKGVNFWKDCWIKNGVYLKDTVI